MKGYDKITKILYYVVMTWKFINPLRTISNVCL